jgi:ribosomal protein S21
MSKFTKSEKNASGFRPIDLSYFSPLQVIIRNGRVDEASKIFKSIVQKEQILTLYNEKSRYVKPSIKKRMKSAAARQRIKAAEIKQKSIDDGSYEKKKLLKDQKRAKRNSNKPEEKKISE